MRIERTFYLCLIAALAILLLLEKCGKGKPCPDVEVKQTVDTVKGESKGYVPKPHRVDTFIREVGGKPFGYPVPYAVHDTLFEPIEGNEYESAPCPPIITSYYSDTMRFDSLGFAVVKDTVRGEIRGRSFSYDLKKYTNTVTLKSKNKWFYGIEAVGNKSDLKYLGATLAWQFKKSDNMIIGGAGVMDNQLYYKAGIMFKIKLK